MTVLLADPHTFMAHVLLHLDAVGTDIGVNNHVQVESTAVTHSNLEKEIVGFDLTCPLRGKILRYDPVGPRGWWDFLPEKGDKLEELGLITFPSQTAYDAWVEATRQEPGIMKELPMQKNCMDYIRQFLSVHPVFKGEIRTKYDEWMTKNYKRITKLTWGSLDENGHHISNSKFLG